MSEQERFESEAEELLKEQESETEEVTGPESGEETETTAEQPAGEEEAQDSPGEEDSEEGPDTPGQEDPDGKEPKGFFHRKKKEDKEKAALKEKVAQLEDRSLRQLAEFENYRKRTEKEKEQRFSMGEKSVIEKILPVVDNFERGLASMPEEEKGKPFASGMEMIYKQLMKQLEDLGVKPIEAVGQPFDPNFHNAVMQVQSEEYESGTVAQEFQKGYTYHDTVVRYSMVGVVA